VRQIVVNVVEAEAEAVEAGWVLQISLRQRQKRKSTYTNKFYSNEDNISSHRLTRPPQMDTTLSSIPILGLMPHDRRLQTLV
jgi:hypothetical protein